MQVNTQNLIDVSQTAREMERLVRLYALDVKPLSRLSLESFYNMVCKLSYKRDPKGVEIVSRPLYVLNSNSSFRDCKKKSILMGAYLFLKKIPFAFWASSSRPDKKIHHVFPIATINKKPLVLDATYGNNQIGKFPAKITSLKRLTKCIN